MTWRDRLADWLEDLADRVRPEHEPLTMEQARAALIAGNQLRTAIFEHSTRHIEPVIARIFPNDSAE